MFEPLDDAEVGRLIRCMMEYKNGGDPHPEGNERFVWPSIRRDIDQSRAAYESECDRQRKNGAKGGRPPKEEKPKKPSGFSENPKNPVVFSETQKTQNNTKQSNTKQSKTKQGIISPNGESIAPDGAAPTGGAKKSFGSFGWVKLTDSDYNRLLNDLGEAEAKRCIAYVDEQAQSTGNKNQWRDWNLVVRRCHRDGWGMPTKQGKASARAPSPGGDRRASGLKKDMDWLDDFLSKQGGQDGETD